MMKGMTAQYLFRQVRPLEAGETILYHAAAGGVGLIACQLARALGVTMIGTVSTDAKAEIARANGCAHVIVTSREDIAKRVREITDGKGVPVVYDSVGKDTLMASLDSLQPRGVLVSNGTSSGPVVVDTTLLAMKGSIWLTRPAMVHYATPRVAHARHGAGGLRLGPRRQDRQRAEPDLRACRRRRGAPRARVRAGRSAPPSSGPEAGRTAGGSRSWMGWPPSDRCRSPRCCGTPSATTATAKSCRGGSRATCYRCSRAELTARARRAANALAAAGIVPGDGVATLAWNGHRHVELAFAACGSGAILHALDPLASSRQDRADRG